MLRRSRQAWSRAVAAIGIVVAASLFAAPTAGAAVAPVPSPSCPRPELTVEPTSVSPGTEVTVTGQSFARCATADGTIGHAFIPLTVGIATDGQIGLVLGTGQTWGGGLVLAKVTIPDIPSAGDTIELAVASADPANGLTYYASVPLAYSRGSATPTAVPAGTGGLRGSEDDADSPALGLAGGVGLALLTAGAVGLRRRRPSLHDRAGSVR